MSGVSCLELIPEMIYSMTVYTFPVLYGFHLDLAIVHLVQNFLYRLNSPDEDI